MANEFDPYREALVVEETTLWPPEYDDWEPGDRQRIERLLHAKPEAAAEMRYIRQHSGFQREIAVTPADLDRVS